MIIAFITSLLISSAPPAVHFSPPIATAVRRALLSELNAHRHKLGAPPLGIDPVAQRAAQMQADDMAQFGRIRHADSYGRLPMTRYEVLGGEPRFYGENVAYYGIRTTEYAIVRGIVGRLDELMMAERPPNDGHRENILSRRFEAVGIGLTLGPNGIFLAEDFVGYRH